MAIRTIREFPSELPHAQLYLDDVEEISTILLEAAAADYAGLNKVPKISYTVGDNTQMDSIEDLQAYGRSTANFKVDLGTYGPTLTFNVYGRPRVQLHKLGEERAWATYSRVKSIFDRRQLHIRNAIGNLPEWLKVSIWMLWCITPALESLFNFRSPLGVYTLVAWTVVAAFFGYEFILQPSRVFFVRSHERSRMSSEATRRIVREIAILVVGSVAGSLITAFILRFLHK